MPEQTSLAVRKTISVNAPPELAFRVFTAAAWWPLATHSVFEAKAITVTIEERVGGRVYETSSDGEESLWGRVTAWDPPSQFAMTWHPGSDPSESTDLEVTFTPEGSGTRVDLVHTGWEKLGDRGQEMSQSYSNGWDTVLTPYTEAMAAAA